MSAGSEVKSEIDDAYELQEHEFTLEPEDESPLPAAARAVPPPPPPRRRELETRARYGSGVFSRPEPQAQPSRDGAAAEVARLRAQLRARDAYLAELERALDERTRQLSQVGIESLADVARLQGRLRGQAFRIAELESELLQLKLRAAEERVLKRSDEPSGAALQRIRGIGPRYAAQLAALGIVRVSQLAAWTEADVAQAASQLHIAASRIAREQWVEQARALEPIASEAAT